MALHYLGLRDRGSAIVTFVDGLIASITKHADSNSQQQHSLSAASSNSQFDADVPGIPPRLYDLSPGPSRPSYTVTPLSNGNHYSVTSQNSDYPTPTGSLSRAVMQQLDRGTYYTCIAALLCCHLPICCLCYLSCSLYF